MGPLTQHCRCSPISIYEYTAKPADPQAPIQNRPSGSWLDDDYDVYDGDRCIGGIMWILILS
jgi:hypothetical protein